MANPKVYLIETRLKKPTKRDKGWMPVGLTWFSKKDHADGDLHSLIATFPDEQFRVRRYTA